MCAFEIGSFSLEIKVWGFRLGLKMTLSLMRYPFTKNLDTQDLATIYKTFIGPWITILLFPILFFSHWNKFWGSTFCWKWPSCWQNAHLRTNWTSNSQQQNIVRGLMNHSMLSKMVFFFIRGNLHGFHFGLEIMTLSLTIFKINWTPNSQQKPWEGHGKWWECHF